MEYTAKECAVCGSDKLKTISRKKSGENIFYTYACNACGETFSTETRFLKQQEALKKQAEREAARQAAMLAKEEAAREAKEAREAAIKSAGVGSPAVESSASGTPSAALSAKEVFKLNRENCVEIQAEFADAISNGTGIVIGKGYVLSNAHVVFPHDGGKLDVADEIRLRTLDGTVYPLDLVYADVEKDVVLLSSDDLHVAGAKFCFDKAVTGETVYAIGNSRGQGICILDGIVSDSSRTVMGNEYVMFSAPTVNGNSGGPIFNVKGEVLGMVTLGQKDGLVMNYAIPVKTLDEFVRRACDKEEVDVALK